VLQVRNIRADEVFMITIPAVSRRSGSGWIDRRNDESLCLPTASFPKSRLSSSSRRAAAESLLSRHRAGDDSGFTLIELMVVLLILAILLAIAIPTFLGVTKSANDRAAQSNLNSAEVNAKTIFQQNTQSYALGVTVASLSSSMATSLGAAIPNLAFSTGAVTSGSTPATLSVSIASDGNAIVLAAQGKGTGNCWYVIDNAAAESATSNGAWSVSGIPDTAGTWYGEAKNTGTAPTCSAAAPIAAAAGTVVYSQSGFPNL
jgi:type IV pilus assembly protein PilA